MARPKKTDSLDETTELEPTSLDGKILTEEAPLPVSPKVTEDLNLVTVTGEYGLPHTGVKVMIEGREHLSCTKDGVTYLVHDNGDGIWLV